MIPAVFAAIPVQRDLLVFFLPMKIFLGRSLLSGDLPLWDPYTENGIPFMANLQSQVFYLPNLVTSVLPVSIGYAAYGAFHLAAAALGTYLWARAYRLSRHAAAVAGLAYALGGPLVAAIEFSSILAVAPWIPWSCWAAVRFARKPDAKRLVAYVVSIALLGLGGEPHTALGGATLSFLFGWLAAGGSEPGSSRHRRILLLVGGGLLGAGLIAVQILPFFELLARSDRGGGLSLELATMHSVGVGDLAGLAAPEPEAFTSPGAGRGQAYLRLQYQGFVTLLAALAVATGWSSLARTERRVAILAVAVFAGGWLLAAGDSLPLFSLLHRSGLLAAMRYPVKFTLPVSAALAMLAAIGVDRLGDRRRVHVLASAGFALACAAAFWSVGDPGWLHSSLFALLAAAVLWWRPRAQSLIVLLLAVDLLIAYAFIHPRLPASAVLADFEAARVVRQAGGRVYIRPYTVQDMEREAALSQAGDTGDTARLARMRVLGLMGNLPMAMQVRASRGGAALRLASQARLLEELDSGPSGIDRLRTSAAGYFSSMDPVSFAPLQPAGVAGPPYLYRIDGALPRTYVACAWRSEVGNRVDAPEVVAGTVVLVDPADMDALPPGGAPAAPVGDATVTPVREGPDERVFDVRSPAPCVLVLVETNYPGWTAEVAGAPARVIEVNDNWLGVAVPPGDVRVTFAFRPESMRDGALVSLIALLLCLMWARRLGRSTA